MKVYVLFYSMPKTQEIQEMYGINKNREYAIADRKMLLEKFGAYWAYVIEEKVR